jgi:hypothetical protein
VEGGKAGGDCGGSGWGGVFGVVSSVDSGMTQCSGLATASKQRFPKDRSAHAYGPHKGARLRNPGLLGGARAIDDRRSRLIEIQPEFATYSANLRVAAAKKAGARA